MRINDRKYTCGSIKGIVSVVAASLLAIAYSPPRAQENEYAEYAESAIKAAYLYHFGTYVDWGEAAAPDDTLTIAILGDIEVFEQLDLYLPGRTIADRSVVPHLIESIDDLDNDEILYIARSENRRLDTLLAEAADGSPGRLIVTDTDDGIPPGAIINFRILENRIRFEIDREAANRSGLTLSSRLLDAAVSVVGDAP